MALNDVEQRVKAVIAKNLDVPLANIRLESEFIKDLGADSLGIVELSLAFEEEFDIDIPDEKSDRIKTVQDAIDFIYACAK
ncbi:MAG: acyl carrier protein [Myxococcales bacterium]|nr:acyl carrier protein [Myxococcales bacterium]